MEHNDVDIVDIAVWRTYDVNSSLNSYIVDYSVSISTKSIFLNQPGNTGVIVKKLSGTFFIAHGVYWRYT